MSKLGIRLEPGGAVFPSPRHLIRGLLSFDRERFTKRYNKCSSFSKTYYNMYMFGNFYDRIGLV